MNLAQQFNSLNGMIVSRKTLELLLEKAEKEKHIVISKRVLKVLEAFKDDTFLIEINNLVEPFGLNGSDDVAGLLGGLDFVPTSEDVGLGKPVSPSEIYDMVTQRMIDLIKNANKGDYKRAWKEEGYLIPYNFVSKKAYRGVNVLMLTPIFGLLDNPYFLTFNQIQEKGGKLRKGAKGHKVIYYSTFSKEYSDAEIEKLNNVLIDNKLEKGDEKTMYFLKYYNVFNGSDIEGINFDLDNFPFAGKVSDDKILSGNNKKIEMAEAIIKNYPQPQPEIFFKGSRAFYSPSEDTISMPEISKFDSSIDFYRTQLHELSHSTGHESRLKRPFANEFGTPEYAFEELIAEFGSVFLSAQAGIMFFTNKNHAGYLKGWNESLLTVLENDNRFLMKASSQAQKLADFVLQPDANGVFKFMKDVNTEFKAKKAVTKPAKKELKPKAVAKAKTPVVEVKKTATDYGKKRAFVSKKGSLVKPFSIKDIPYEVAYRAHTGTSFSPEKRAESEQKSYLQFMNDVWDEQLKIAEKKGFLDIFEERFLRFKEGYLSKTLAFLRSKHGVFSSMIAGPSNFPVARMNKKNAIVNSRLNELIEYGDKYQQLFKKELQPVIIKTGTEQALSQLEVKLKKEEEAHEKTLMFNKIMRKKITPENKKTELLKAGFSEDFISRAEKSGFTTLGSYVSTNASARIRNLKAQIELENKLKAKKETGNKEVVFDGGTAVWNYDLNRFQLLFESKPDEATRTALKGGGLAFKWSPKESAWQRQLNTFGQYNFNLLVKVIPSLANKSAKAVSDIKEPVSNITEPAKLDGNQYALFGALNGAKTNKNSLAYKMANKPTNVDFFKIEDKGIADFLGKIEHKKKESIVISLTGGQGSMKTRMCFQFINALAQNYKVGHASIEEHPESSLYYDKAEQYLNAKALQNIESPEIKSVSDLEMLIRKSEVVIIDSFSKMQEMQKGFEVDKDLRKKYDGKLFIVIFQQTTDGKMRGGSKSQFDADIVLFTEKMADYRDNYIFADKNRYQNKPLDGLKFNIFSKKLVMDEPEVMAEPTKKKKLSFIVN
jgi:antirestriction protein ArdC